VSSSSTDTKDIRKFGTVALVFFGALGAVGVGETAAYLFFRVPFPYGSRLFDGTGPLKARL
jgi:hypothetical protein